MKILAMFSTLLVTLTTVGWYGESQQCIELRAQLQQQQQTLVVSSEQMYLMASCEALAGNNDGAFVYLNKLKDSGFTDADWLLADVQFESLHQDGRWQPLLDDVSSIEQQMLAEIYSQEISQ